MLRKIKFASLKFRERKLVLHLNKVVFCLKEKNFHRCRSRSIHYLLLKYIPKEKASVFSYRIKYIFYGKYSKEINAIIRLEKGFAGRVQGGYPRRYWR